MSAVLDIGERRVQHGRMPGAERVVVIGAGVGGLAAAMLLAARGLEVVVLEATDAPGGKMREMEVAGRMLDAGPTVLTWVELFDRLFEDAGARRDRHLGLAPAATLARHFWPDGSRLDLPADPDARLDAIAAIAGSGEARAYRRFAAEAARIWATLERWHMGLPRTNPLGLIGRMGVHRIGELQAVRPYESLWRALTGQFRDPRLVQLFARYATYCGASPLKAPATLMLIAHLESRGVWLVEGGMHRLAVAMAEVARARGAVLRFGVPVAEILVAHGRAAGVRLADGEALAAGAIVANCDPDAIGAGRFGAAARRAVGETPRAARSLSSVTSLLVAEAEGPPLDRHNIFFSTDSRAEFAAIAAGRLPSDPTVYVCAQDRDGNRTPARPERFQIIVNAPAEGDRRPLTPMELDRCRASMLNSLRRCGLSLRWSSGSLVEVTPQDYEARYPSTGGALYGRASHGPLGAFLRPGSRTRLPGLYLAGGATHPGAGIPMAALSGRLASDAILGDRASMPRFHPAAMPGGMSTPSPTTAAMAWLSSPSSARSSRPIM
jgi:1-hydroxycarotenoid 3,4-desaturase